MWNPFKKVQLEPVLMATNIEPAIKPQDAAIERELDSLRLKTLLARTKITMIHESLASSALDAMRGSS